MRPLILNLLILALSCTTAALLVFLPREGLEDWREQSVQAAVKAQLDAEEAGEKPFNIVACYSYPTPEGHMAQLSAVISRSWYGGPEEESPRLQAYAVESIRFAAQGMGLELPEGFEQEVSYHYEYD